MKQLSTKKRLLAVMIPMVVFPLFFVCIYSFGSLYHRILRQEREFYQDIINQTASNIDFYYNQYAIHFIEIAKSHQMKALADRPVMSALEEQNFHIDRLSYHDSLVNLVAPKFRGLFFLLELNRNNPVSGTAWNILSTTNNNLDIQVDKLLRSQVYHYMEEKKDMNPVFCISPAIRGTNAERRPQFFCPDISNAEDKISNIMLVVEGSDFCHSLYEKNTRLKLGTLYIRDLFGNVMDTNHPYKDDYYDYDKERKRYILNPDDDINDPFEGMSFAEYRMLNTDPEILQSPHIVLLAERAKEEESCISDIFSFHGRRYLVIHAIAENSQAQITYFHPLQQILSPVYHMIAIFLLLTALIVVVAITVSVFFSCYFTRPLNDLVHTLHQVEKGDYNAVLNHSHEFGEFIDVGITFDRMQKTISTYHNKMEELVKERTEELSNMYQQFQQELQVAQKLQALLIPEESIPPLHLCCMYRPMETIGGDLYDVYPVSEMKYAAVILDVCGHGIPAALVTTMAKLSFRSNSQRNPDPVAVVRAVNQEMADVLSGSGNYFTAFYCLIDLKQKSLTYVNAGHNPMLLLGENGNVRWMESTGAVIGVMKELDFLEGEENLFPNDRLVLFTDGITETRNREDGLYGEARLLNVIKNHPDDTVQELKKDLDNFRQERPFSDDLTFVLLKLPK